MKSEFAQLSDLVISQGASHSDLIAEINSAVLEEFRQKFPNAPISSTVFVNELTGEVRILSGKKDITPAEFSNRAQQIARQVLINKIHPASGEVTVFPSTEPRSKQTISPVRKPGSWITILANIFFWGYNIYFFLFTVLLTFSYVAGLFGNLPSEGLKTVGAARVILFLILLATPIGSTILAFRQKLYRSSGSLGRLFFLFELPVVVACLIPLALANQTTPFLVLLTLLGLCLPVILYVYESHLDLSSPAQKILLFVQQFVLMIGSYLTFLFSFFTPVILGTVVSLFFGNFFYSMGSGNSYDSYYPVPSPEPIIGLLFQATFGILAVLLVTAVLLVPFLLLILLAKALIATHRNLQTSLSNEELITLHAVYAGIILFISIAAAYQPSSGKLLDNLKNITNSESFEEREVFAKQLIGQESRVKQLITDMYYSRSRFLFAKDDTTLQNAYQQFYKFNDTVSTFIQDIFLVAAYPFVFQGDRDTSGLLTANFGYVFGYSPFEEKKPDKKPTEIKPAQNVLLTYRKVTVKPEANGMVAQISVEEEYDNVSYSQQEVIYEFTVPPDTAFTSLRLGPNLEFPGIIAPKGAAQRTYERELQRRRDPALLEQTGPRQYRLRVFPIPAKNDWTTLQGKRQKAEYTFVASLTPKGFPLPFVVKKTNVFTNASSQLTLFAGGKQSSMKDNDTWIPIVKTSSPDICKNPPEDFIIPTGTLTARITALPKRSELKNLSCGTIKEVLDGISSTNIAILIDVSSDKEAKVALDSFVSLLKDKKFLENNTVEMYKFNDHLSGVQKLTPGSLDNLTGLTFFGKSDLLTALTSFSGNYDAVFVITGSHSPKSQTGTYPFSRSSRVYMVHSKMPQYDMQFTSKLLQSDGDSFDSIDEALRKFALTRAVTPLYDRSAPVGSPYVQVVFTNLLMELGAPADEMKLLQPFKGVQSIPGSYANNALFRDALRFISSDVTGDITVLDKLNAFAVQAPLVTPYSSLLALVNEQQQQLLEEFKKQYNRYQDQPAQENIVNPPLPRGPIMPMFESMGQSKMMPLGGGSDLMMGSGSISGPGITLPKPSSMRISSVGNLFSNGLVLFIFGNIFILGFGFLFYLIRILRKKHP